MSKKYPRRWFVNQIEKYLVRISYNKRSFVWFRRHFNDCFPNGFPVVWIQPQITSLWFYTGCDVYSDHTRINKIFKEDSSLPGCTAACWMSDSCRHSERSNGLGLTKSENKCIGSVKTLTTIYDSTGCKNAKDLSLYQHHSHKFKTQRNSSFKITTDLLYKWAGLDSELTWSHIMKTPSFFPLRAFWNELQILSVPTNALLYILHILILTCSRTSLVV
jgi:hypothetical protein